MPRQFIKKYSRKRKVGGSRSRAITRKYRKKARRSTTTSKNNSRNSGGYSMRGNSGRGGVGGYKRYKRRYGRVSGQSRSINALSKSLIKVQTGLKTLTGRNFSNIRQTNETNNTNWFYQSINTMPDLTVLMNAINQTGETIVSAGLVPMDAADQNNVKKILVAGAKNDIKLVSGSNTIIDCVAYYCKPRYDSSSLLTDSQLTTWIGNQSTLTGTATTAYLKNPMFNLFNLSGFTSNWNVYHTKRFKMHPGREYNLSIESKKQFYIKQIENKTIEKIGGKQLVLRFTGQLINDSSAIPVTSYGSYLVNITSTETYNWYEMPNQIRPLPVLNTAPVITGTVNIINETSGLKTVVQDTISSTLIAEEDDF